MGDSVEESLFVAMIARAAEDLQQPRVKVRDRLDAIHWLTSADTAAALSAVRGQSISSTDFDIWRLLETSIVKSSGSNLK